MHHLASWKSLRNSRQRQTQQRILPRAAVQNPPPSLCAPRETYLNTSIIREKQGPQNPWPQGRAVHLLYKWLPNHCLSTFYEFIILAPFWCLKITCRCSGYLLVCQQLCQEIVAKKNNNHFIFFFSVSVDQEFRKNLDKRFFTNLSHSHRMMLFGPGSDDCLGSL